MRSVFRTACVIAVPVEAINFWIIGYPAGSHSLAAALQSNFLALQWYVLHLPGIIVVDHSRYARLHDWASSLILLLFGFIDTALLFAFALWIARRTRRLNLRLSSPQKVAAPAEQPRSTRLSA